MAARPVLVAFGHRGADEPDHRLDAREYLHGASPALDFPVGALLDVIGPDAAAVLGKKRQVCERESESTPTSLTLGGGNVWAGTASKSAIIVFHLDLFTYHEIPSKCSVLLLAITISPSRQRETAT